VWVRFPRISRMQNGILPGNINALPTTLASNIANHQYVHQNYHSTSSSSKHCYKEFIFLLKIYWIPLPRSNIRHIRDKDAESIRRASKERGGAKSGTDPALSSADFTTCAHDQCMNGAHVEAPTRVRTPHARTHNTHTHTHTGTSPPLPPPARESVYEDPRERHPSEIASCHASCDHYGGFPAGSRRRIWQLRSETVNGRRERR